MSAYKKRDQLGMDVVVMPPPMYVLRQSGARSLRLHGVNVALRLHKQDYELIRRVAERLGVSISGYLRWCAVMAAADLEYIHTGKRPEVRC